MVSLTRALRKTLKRGTNAVRSVGKATRKTLRRGTNTLGLTKHKKRTAHKKRATHRRSR